MKKNNKKGFTLAELLIVVAIIAVLVAIAIPIFTSQLEKSRESTDAANVRDYYSEISTALLTGELTNAVSSKSQTLVGNNLTATISGYTASITKSDTFTVTVANYNTVQQQNGWQGGAPNVAGVTLSDWSSLGSGKNLVYTFTVGSDGDVYLSGVSLGTP